MLYTVTHCQLVLMASKPKEDIGVEVKNPDQFFRVEEGSGEVVLDGVHTPICDGLAVVVPAGTTHNSLPDRRWHTFELTSFPRRH